MDERALDLSKYRLKQAEESFEVAQDCLRNNHYKDAVNRSYYAAFYAVKAVLALDQVDFKRHKDVMAYFNKTYVATGLFPRDLGRNLGRAQQKRERSDYDDFYIASKEEAEEQLYIAGDSLKRIHDYLSQYLC